MGIFLTFLIVFLNDTPHKRKPGQKKKKEKKENPCLISDPLLSPSKKFSKE